jgi:phage tail sheath protein FI
VSVLPTTEVTIGERVGRNFIPGSTDIGFLVGLAERGPVDKPVFIVSLGHFVTVFGERVAYSPLYDELDLAFRDGLAGVYIQRVVGPAAKASTGKVKDGVGGEAKDTLQIDAASPGEWGDDIDWKVFAGVTEGTFRLQVKYDGTVVETSEDLADNTAAVNYFANSSWVRLKDLAEGNPTASEGSLTGGDDDRAEVDSEVIDAGFALFPPDLGPGQLCAPGYTTEAVHVACIVHAALTTRTPILDGEDTDKAEDLIADAVALRAQSGGRHAGFFAPWITVPGITPNTTRTVPPSAVVLGLLAKSDRQNGHANVAVAGPNGKSSYAIGVTQAFSDEDRGDMNSAGVNVIGMDEGAVTILGFRTLADPVTDRNWLPLSNARLMMDLAFGTKKVLKRFLFANLDAQGETKATAEGVIVGEVITPKFLAGAIFGESPEDACQIVVEQDVNPSDGSIGKLTGSLAAKPTKFNERTEFEVVSVAPTESF